jgi:hypothetical protein
LGTPIQKPRVSALQLLEGLSALKQGVDVAPERAAFLAFGRGHFG